MTSLIKTVTINMIVIKLSPRNKAPRPPKLKYETLYILVEFLSNFNVNPPART